MKTFLPFLTALLISTALFAQNTPGLVFKNPTLDSGNALKVKSVYLFKSVATGTHAKIRIDSAVNGAKLKKIDDNSAGLGYLNAFQPEIEIPNHEAKAYMVFTVTFIDSVTGNIKPLNDVQATAIDIDGNLLLKEFVELGMNGGTASFRTGTLDISVLSLLLNNFRGQNILGIERDGLDTTALGNMYTVSKSNVSSYTIRAGATNLLGGSDDRQFSIFMKGFNYIQTTTLPVKLESFNAFLGTNSKVDLKWVTSSEINVSHFVVEKSYDGVVFGETATVFAYGNTVTRMNYAATDNIASTNSPVVYYRLRSVDIDGKTSYSEVRIIRTAKQTNNEVTILTYPNPATNEVRITIPANWQNKKVVYELFSVNGQTAKKIENANSSQTESVNITSLKSGIYMVRVSCNGETAQQKIVKQ
jgi:hypothetical protein